MVFNIHHSEVRLVRNSYLPWQVQGSAPTLKAPTGHPSTWSLGGRFSRGQENEMSSNNLIPKNCPFHKEILPGLGYFVALSSTGIMIGS